MRLHRIFDAAFRRVLQPRRIGPQEPLPQRAIDIRQRNGVRRAGQPPATRMLAMARSVATEMGAAERTTFVNATVEAVAETPPHDAATSLFVMHFLPDDGAKLDYLTAIRRRLRPDGAFMLSDVSFDSRADREHMTPLFLAQARLAGVDVNEIHQFPDMMHTLPIIGAERTRALLSEAGFDATMLVFQGLWYRAWMATAR